METIRFFPKTLDLPGSSEAADSALHSSSTGLRGLPSRVVHPAPFEFDQNYSDSDSDAAALCDSEQPKIAQTKDVPEKPATHLPSSGEWETSLLLSEQEEMRPTNGKKQRACGRSLLPGGRVYDTASEKVKQKHANNHKRRCEEYPPRTLSEAERERIQTGTLQMLQTNPFVKNMDIVMRFNVGYLQAMQFLSKCDRSIIIETRRNITANHAEIIKRIMETEPCITLEQICERVSLPMNRVHAIRSHYLAHIKKKDMMDKILKQKREEKKAAMKGANQKVARADVGNVAASEHQPQESEETTDAAKRTSDADELQHIESDEFYTRSREGIEALIDEKQNRKRSNPAVDCEDNEEAAAYINKVDKTITNAYKRNRSHEFNYSPLLMADTILFWLQHPRATLQEAADALEMRYTRMSHITRAVLKLTFDRHGSVHRVQSRMARHADVFLHACKFNKMCYYQRLAQIAEASAPPVAPHGLDLQESEHRQSKNAAEGDTNGGRKASESDSEDDPSSNNEFSCPAAKNNSDSVPPTTSDSATFMSLLAAPDADNNINNTTHSSTAGSNDDNKPDDLLTRAERQNRKRNAYLRIGPQKFGPVGEEQKRLRVQTAHAKNYQRRRIEFPSRPYQDGEFEYIVEEARRMVNEDASVKNMDIVKRFQIGYVQAMRVIAKCDRKKVREIRQTEMQGNIQTMRAMLNENPYLTQEQIVEKSGLSQSRVRHIIEFYIRGLTQLRPPKPKAVAKKRLKKSDKLHADLVSSVEAGPASGNDVDKVMPVVEQPVSRYSIVYYYPFELAVSLKAEIARNPKATVQELADALQCDTGHIRNALISAPGLRMRKHPIHHEWYILPSAPFDYELEKRVLDEWFLLTVRLMNGDFVLDEADVKDGEVTRRLQQSAWPAHLNADEYGGIERVALRAQHREQLIEERDRKRAEWEALRRKVRRSRPFPPPSPSDQVLIDYELKMQAFRLKFNTAMRDLREKYAAAQKPLATSQTDEAAGTPAATNKIINYNMDHVALPQREKRKKTQQRSRKRDAKLPLPVKVAKVGLERSLKHPGCLVLVFRASNNIAGWLKKSHAKTKKDKRLHVESVYNGDAADDAVQENEPKTTPRRTCVLVRPFILSDDKKNNSEAESDDAVQKPDPIQQIKQTGLFRRKLTSSKQQLPRKLNVQFEYSIHCPHLNKNSAAGDADGDDDDADEIKVTYEAEKPLSAKLCAECKTMLNKASHTMLMLVQHGGEPFVKMLLSGQQQQQQEVHTEKNSVNSRKSLPFALKNSAWLALGEDVEEDAEDT